MHSPLTKLSPEHNAYRFTFDTQLLAPLQQLYRSHIAQPLEKNAQVLAGGKDVRAILNSPVGRFFVMSYKTAPLLWVSNDDKTTYQYFSTFLDALDLGADIKRLVNHRKEVVMYSGFFVVGNHLDEPLWHVDYFETANAYTFLTPLFELDPSHGGLLYTDTQKHVYRYKYKLGEGVIIGDGFLHTTEPYPPSGQRVLLSLTVGTDKSEHWPVLERTIGTQSRFMYLPCGHQAGTCSCVELKYKNNYIA